MSLDIMGYTPVGDKQSSDFFNEYRMKIYARRKSSGLEELLGRIRALVVSVETGDALPYLQELYLMSPYRFHSAYQNETHKIYILESNHEMPRFVVLEPLLAGFVDDLTRLNMLYPLSRNKPNARYVGEIFTTRDLPETQKTLESHNIRFHYPHETENSFFSNPHFMFTFPSSITGNRVGYMPEDTFSVDELEIGMRIQLDAAIVEALERAAARAHVDDPDQLILGVDHMATRILAGEREDAILEFLTLSNYYFWGA